MTNYCPHKSIAPSRWLMTFALVVWSSLSYAQMRTEDIYDRGERRRDIPATGIIDPDAPVDSIGGKKERRQKRPMESYLFVDSVRNLNAFHGVTIPITTTWCVSISTPCFRVSTATISSFRTKV